MWVVSLYTYFWGFFIKKRGIRDILREHIDTFF